MRAHRWSAVPFVVAAALVVVACGGGDDTADDTAGDASGGGDAATDSPPLPTDANADGSDDDPGGDTAGSGTGNGAVVRGEPTLTADPGTASAEVGGERSDYAAAGSINVDCIVTDEQVAINFQTPEGHDFVAQGAPLDGDWFVSMTFAPGGNSDRYGADSASGGGVFTVGDGTLSYEGVVSRVVDFDITNAEDVDAQVAVELRVTGRRPDGDRGRRDLRVPGERCPKRYVRGQRHGDRRAYQPARDRRPATRVERTDQGGQWVGAAVVYTADGNFTAPLPPDGTGLTLDGTSVTFEGTFQSPNGDEVDGSVDITC